MNKSFLGGLMASLLVAACGGGGGNSTPTSPQPKAMVAHGTITGFGSVIVDGVHYDTSHAQFEVDDQSGHSQDDFAVGQRVTVAGTVDDHGNHVADHVDYEAEVKGTVSAVDAAAGSFTALGQSVRVDASTVFVGLADLAALSVGDFVEVSGTRQADDSILASFVKREAPEAEAQVRGEIASLDAAATRFQVGAQVVDYGAATLLPAGYAPANGDFVEVEGTLAAGTLNATVVKREGDLGGEDAGTEAHLQGVIRDVAADRSSFHVDATQIRVSGTTTYEHGTASDLVAGAAVEVEGTVQSDGSLSARKVEFQAEHEGEQARVRAAISAIDAGARTFEVLGLTVHVADATVFRDDRDGVRTFGFSNLVVGDFVEVGLSQASGVFTASKVEREQARAEADVQGGVESFDGAARSLVVSGVTVDGSAAQYRLDGAPVSAAQFYAAVTVGSVVEARGSFAGGVLTASQVELDRGDSSESSGG